MTARPLMLSLAISATLLAGCTQKAAPTQADAGKLRTLGSLQFKPCSLPSPFPQGDPLEAVSYTHLDVYKRQRCLFASMAPPPARLGAAQGMPGFGCG